MARSFLRVLLLAVPLAVGLARMATAASGAPTLEAVRARGMLVCGVSGTLAGFSLPDSQGVMRGLDADTCRAIAAGALGDASKVRFVPTTTENRFTALQSGEVDVLARDTTWTLGREASLGLEFAAITFFDGTGFLVKKSAGLIAAKELDGATICVQPGTSTELAISDFFRTHGLKFTPLSIQDVQGIRAAFLSGRCDAYSTDSSSLASFRATQGAQASDFVLLPDVISKEPLGPMVRKGDDRWLDLVRWTVYALITAEEEGVTSANAAGFGAAAPPGIRRLLGLEGGLGTAMGVDDRWAFNAVSQVGNYAEIWARNLAPLGIARGQNRLWSGGGLLYAPPIR